MLLAKQNKDSELWTQANSIKLAPKLISINETTLSAIVDGMNFQFHWSQWVKYVRSHKILSIPDKAVTERNAASICTIFKKFPCLVFPGTFHNSIYFLELDVMEKVTEEDLENYSVEDLRAVFVRLALRMRNRLAETEAQQNEMNLLAREITAMQNMRR